VKIRNCHPLKWWILHALAVRACLWGFASGNIAEIVEGENPIASLVLTVVLPIWGIMKIFACTAEPELGCRWLSRFLEGGNPALFLRDGSLAGPFTPPLANEN
jgi:hypothetical protein